MSPDLLKTILAIIFFLAALLAALSMLTLMGKPPKKIGPEKLKRLHKIAGILFGLLLIPLIYLGAKFLVQEGDSLPLRALFHAVLALFLVILFLLKFSIVKTYKQFLRMAPVLGMTLFVLAFVVFAISGGYYLLQGAASRSGDEKPVPSSKNTSGDIEKGASLYSRLCSGCHFADQDASRVGPGLKGIGQKDKLPSSGKPATEENIRRQLKSPLQAMPAFGYLSEKEITDLLAYLKTL